MARTFFHPSMLALPSLIVGLGAVTAFAGGPSLRSAPARGLAYSLEASPRDRAPVSEQMATLSTGAEVKPEQVDKARASGATWLESVQKADGGWGAGSWGADDPSAPSDVATTSLTILALVRDGGGVDKHRPAIRKAVRFVTRTIQESPKRSPEINSPGQTQPQYKLGRLVDTHLAAMMLGELVGTLDDETNIAMDQAYDRVLGKVQMAQRDDGSFDGDGWAPILSSTIAASALNRGVELGRQVDQAVIDANDRYQASKIDSKTGAVTSGEGAGVDLYSVASALKGNKERKDRITKRSSDRPADPGLQAAQKEAEIAEAAATDRVVGDASGQLFTGFGSAGGEEMLSYMMISDTLSEEGGERWEGWNGKVGSYLVGTQNADGSWAGHHCITSRTFVTAAAMMTLGAPEAATMRAERAARSEASTLGAFSPDHRTK